MRNIFGIFLISLFFVGNVSAACRLAHSISRAARALDDEASTFYKLAKNDPHHDNHLIDNADHLHEDAHEIHRISIKHHHSCRKVIRLFNHADGLVHHLKSDLPHPNDHNDPLTHQWGHIDTALHKLENAIWPHGHHH